ncbi:flavodoxin FldB [Pseudoteredinibacter isoporae]|uniref:Flavodoxin n=1 Tax=Pseudoteredinibacter isoporae TaxID=570281 RepID=A0A7X0JUF2_9GAMM|nr:flavodoxin FldB [Pseudoteredinibacter isoporae]MBB6522367.1 flavodoxin II [Pseudoteredinibacter isoporae]NHO87900.1 flavodoxin FldB [Pseudoteredinibacter isoporae]NIB23769.1 flavodoxin FldB [Pseudoteredinibacter isoporae]
MSIDIALFYGSSTCYTEIAAEKIQNELQDKHQATVTLFNIADEDIGEAQHYEFLLFGIPTWDYGELQEDWEDNWDAIDDIHFSGKKVAIFGLGDQVGYPEWFLDAMGYLHDKVASLGAKMCGYWPNQGYNFEASTALNEDETLFNGLALDEENEFDLSEERIAKWCQQIMKEFQSA